MDNPKSTLVNLESKAPGTELREYFGHRARKLASEIERGLPVEPREIALLVKAAREIVALEAV